MFLPLKLATAIVTIVLCMKPTHGAFYKAVTTKWIVQKSSTLQINGSSNVNKFQCAIQGYYRTDTLALSSATSKTLVPLTGALCIDVADFDCKNKLITRDLRKTLKADSHPKLIVRFVALERAPVFSTDNKDALKGYVEVDLAGTCKRFEIPFTLSKNGSSLIELHGMKDFKFSDFKLKPPSKVGGLVKVNDKFTVNFHLAVNQLTF